MITAGPTVAEVLESADQEMYRSKARKSPDSRKRNRAACAEDPDRLAPCVSRDCTREG